MAPSGEPAARSAAARWTPLVIVAAASIVVFHGALAYFFSQDDFLWLAHARGALPPHDVPWRWVSYGVFFRAMNGLAGLDAKAYHLASLAAHIAASFLLYLLLRRRGIREPAALVGAVFFAAHPALFTAVYWISAIADLMAVVFALAAILSFDAQGWRRWWAVPLVGLSILSKESTLLLPLWLAVFGRRRWGNEPTGRSGLGDPVAWAAISAALLYGIYFVRADVFGTAGAADHAYALRIDASLVRNLLSYLGWSVDVPIFTVRTFEEGVDPGVFPWAIGLLLVWCAGLFMARLRGRGWTAAGALALTFLLPVLPLAHHLYHYYLYGPLVGISWCVAAALDVPASQPRTRAPVQRRVAGSRERGPRGAGGTNVRPRSLAWSISILICAALTANGAALVSKIEYYPFVQPPLRAHPTVDRALIARHMMDDLGASSLPPGARLLFWFPRRSGPQAPGGTGRETYWERNIKAAVEGPVGIRVMFPELGDVQFVDAVARRPGEDLYAVYRIDGHLQVLTAGALDSLIRSTPATR